MTKRPDPTKEPEFQKVVRHFVMTAHKPHSAMKIGKSKAKASPMASPPEKCGRPNVMPAEYSIGVSDISSDVPEPMKLLMRENSRALDDEVTSRFRDSHLPKPTPG